MEQYIWPIAISATCKISVCLDFRIIGYLTYLINFPPLFPEKQNVVMFFFLAAFIASMRLRLFPEVVIAIAISPEFP